MPTTAPCWCWTAPAGTRAASWWSPPASISSSCQPPRPSLQPVERLWPLVDEPVANRTFAALDDLPDVLVIRCQVLRAATRHIKAHTRFWWWPTERRPRKHQ